MEQRDKKKDNKILKVAERKRGRKSNHGSYWQEEKRHKEPLTKQEILSRDFKLMEEHLTHFKFKKWCEICRNSE